MSKPEIDALRERYNFYRLNFNGSPFDQRALEYHERELQVALLQRWLENNTVKE